MGDLDALVSGVVSSILAVAVVEVYLRLRDGLRRRTLRQTLGFYREPCSIITPAHMIEGSRWNEMLEIGDVFAIGHALALCERVKSPATLVSSLARGPRLDKNKIVIGGWGANEVTASLLATYCPGLLIHRGTSGQADPSDEAAAAWAGIFYQCGDVVLRESPDVTNAFVIKLAKDLTGLDDSILIAWGHEDLGTTAAMFYLSDPPPLLSRTGGRSFFVALRVQQKLGYRGVIQPVLDLTQAAFTPLPVDAGS